MGIPSRLSLSAAQEIAFANNFDLVATQANVDLAVATKIAAYEWPNPNFTFSPTKIDIHQRQGTSLGNSWADRTYDTIVAVSELFEIGKRSRRQASARAGVEAARAQLEDAHRTLDLGVTKAYLAALLAEANATVLSDSARALRKEATIAKTRLNAGDLSDSDQAQIEINADQLDLNAKSAESTAIQARIQLEVLLGDRHPDGKIELTESLGSLANIPSGVVFTVPVNRPDVVAAEAAVRKADYDIALRKPAGSRTSPFRLSMNGTRRIR
ncbi:MAG TPA: TolC family protein [Chthoniobacterales bacterium]